MESLGEPGKVHVSEAVTEALAGRFSFVERGAIDVKGAGRMQTFFLGDPIERKPG
jgi:class 3 adenylate cyclase